MRKCKDCTKNSVNTEKKIECKYQFYFLHEKILSCPDFVEYKKKKR